MTTLKSDCEILEVIGRLEAEGTPTTYRNISKNTELVGSTIFYSLKGMADLGLVSRSKSLLKSRKGPPTRFGLTPAGKTVLENYLAIKKIILDQDERTGRADGAQEGRRIPDSIGQPDVVAEAGKAD